MLPTRVTLFDHYLTIFCRFSILHITNQKYNKGFMQLLTSLQNVDFVLLQLPTRFTPYEFSIISLVYSVCIFYRNWIFLQFRKYLRELKTVQEDHGSLLAFSLFSIHLVMIVQKQSEEPLILAWVSKWSLVCLLYVH